MKHSSLKLLKSLAQAKFQAPSHTPKLQNQFHFPFPSTSCPLPPWRTYFSGMASGSTDLLGNYSQLSGCLTDEAQSRAGRNEAGNKGGDGRQARHVGVAWRALVQCNELESCLISVALGIKLARGAGTAKVATQRQPPCRSLLTLLPSLYPPSPLSSSRCSHTHTRRFIEATVRVNNLHGLTRGDE